MKTVSVSQLKAELSRWLREVRRGSEIQILDRGVPIARLTQPGAPATGQNEKRQRLARAGVLRAGSGDVRKLLRQSPLKLETSISDALQSDRADRV